MKVSLSLLMFSYLFLTSIALAANPTISGINGPIVDGKSINLSGTGFGSLGPQIRLFDNFENGTVGNVIGINNAVIGSWSSLSTSSKVAYTGSYHMSGTKAFISDQSDANLRGKLIFQFTGDDPDMFVSWWELIPAGQVMPGCDNVAGGGCNWKMVWFVRGDVNAMPGMSDLVNYVQLSGNGDSTNASSNSFGGFGWITSNSPNNWQSGRWTRLWTYIKSSTSSSGIYDSWFLHAGIPPTHARNVSNVQTLATGAVGPYNRIDVPGYCRQTKTTPVYDDVYVATGPGARARVEIGNNLTYTQCTTLHVMPITNWSDTSIQATVNIGNFVSGQTAYLFVIDANGNISTGKQIIIGEASTIKAPTNLILK